MKARRSVLALVFLVASAGFSCPQAEAPPDQTSSPQPESTPAPAQDQAPPPVTPQTQEAPNPAKAGCTKRTPQRHKMRRKKKPTSTNEQQGKVIVRNGGARDNSAQLAPGMSKEQEQHNRASTAQLLATTRTNLQMIEGRQLTASQTAWDRRLEQRRSEQPALPTND